MRSCLVVDIFGAAKTGLVKYSILFVVEEMPTEDKAEERYNAVLADIMQTRPAEGVIKVCSTMVSPLLKGRLYVLSFPSIYALFR